MTAPHTDCVVCHSAPDGDAAGWIAAALDEPIEWRNSLGPLPTLAAAVYSVCGPCAAWLPDARTGEPPAAVRATFDRGLGLFLPGVMVRHLHSEMLGQRRHLAQQLRPIETP